MTAKAETDSTDLLADQVEQYLRDNPTFFMEREALLSDLFLPHARGGAVSLVEKQVNLLRERNIDSRKRLNQFVLQAKDNDELLKKIQKLTLAMMDADSLTDLVRKVNERSLVLFDVEAVQISFIAEAFHAHAGLQKLSKDKLNDQLGWLNTVQGSICGHFREEELEALFPGRQDIRSAIVLPVRHNEQLQAVLCFGSANSRYFDSSMDTFFVEYVAAVLGRLISGSFGS